MTILNNSVLSFLIPLGSSSIEYSRRLKALIYDGQRGLT